MAKIKTLEPAVRNIRGRVASRDSVHFKTVHDQTYAVRVDNPYHGPQTEEQKQITDKFKLLQAQTLNLATSDPEKYAELSRKFKTQRTYKTLRGYIFAKLWFEAEQEQEQEQEP